MASGREQKQTSVIVRTNCIETLHTVLRLGSEQWPLPPPPLQDPDFPQIEPDDAESVVEKGVGLFTVDQASFESRLENTRSEIIPHRLSLTADPVREGERWLLRRMDEVSSRILFDTCVGWLAAGLDESAPDSERWYIGITLLNGLCRQPDGLSVNQGYHMLECIALAHPPGSWPTRANAGPHNIGWTPDAGSRMVVRANEGGIDAAHWLLDSLEQGGVDRRLLLVSWMRSLLERPELVRGMALAKRFELMVVKQPAEVAAAMVDCLPRLLEVDAEAGLVVLNTILARDEQLVSVALASELPALLRVVPKIGLEVLDNLLSNSDESTRALAVSSLRELVNNDSQAFLERVKPAATDESTKIRRIFVQSNLRHYLEMDAFDSQEIFVPLWLENDEVVAARMRELLIRMQEVNPPAFSEVAKTILQQSEDGFDRFWQVLSARDPERVKEWEEHLAGNSGPPEPLN